MGPLELRQSVTGSEVTLCKGGEPLCRSVPDSNLDKPEAEQNPMPAKEACYNEGSSVNMSVNQLGSALWIDPNPHTNNSITNF